MPSNPTELNQTKARNGRDEFVRFPMTLSWSQAQTALSKLILAAATHPGLFYGNKLENRLHSVCMKGVIIFYGYMLIFFAIKKSVQLSHQ